MAISHVGSGGTCGLFEFDALIELEDSFFASMAKPFVALTLKMTSEGATIDRRKPPARDLPSNRGVPQRALREANGEDAIASGVARVSPL
ncbi:MAG: hypothetical protein AAF219_08935 [Myxococcota bacterium]